MCIQGVEDSGQAIYSRERRVCADDGDSIERDSAGRVGGDSGPSHKSYTRMTCLPLAWWGGGTFWEMEIDKG